MRVDDYKEACRLAAASLMDKNPDEVARFAGAERTPEGFRLSFLGRPVVVRASDMAVSWENQKPDETFSLTDTVLILHYLQGAGGQLPTGNMVAYRQITGGEFYQDAFHRRAEIPLAQTFGQTPGLLTKAVALMGGTLVPDFGDESGKFTVLPHIDLITLVYLGDEEFESSGKVLFDAVISAYLSLEDAAWLGSALVYRLMGAARTLQN
ncbi:DUF3786 domain-containing protein [Desulfosarcina sp. OttesenSCG-928-A07]|nr:DUF3786 domain-containing protein [Desulfosarcina sp. OttesenSCG-928-G17]MDL2328214.1 DUF3786 domain-containing protein [Desulfosarcina sp. OttesenSCG-928-A07]